DLPGSHTPGPPRAAGCAPRRYGQQPLRPELMHGAGLMQACEPLRESVTVDGDVCVVLRTEDSICNAVWLRPALPTGWSSGTWITARSWSRSPKEKKAIWNSGLNCTSSKPRVSV